MKTKFKNFLYKAKKKVIRFPKDYLGNVFWEENQDNMYYGHYDIFRTYTKSALPFKINGEVQHGWAGENSGFHIIQEKLNEGPTHERFYVFNETNKKKCNYIGYNNVVVIGAPFIYLNDFYKPNLEYYPRSLILFPYHSTEWDPFSDPIGYYKKYLSELKEILLYFNKITVSLYWLEYENVYIRNIFKSAGINVTTMGPRDNNPDFLFKFIRIIKKHEYVCSNIYSSAIFYSLFLKKKAFVFFNNLVPDIDDDSYLINKINSLFSQKYPQLLWEKYDDKSHFDISKIELGLNFKKSPKELSDLFGWNINTIVKKIIL